MERRGFSGRMEERSDNPNTQKRDTSDVRNYKGVILLCTAYKNYAAILAEKLREEIEGKGSLKHRYASEREEESWIM